MMNKRVSSKGSFTSGNYIKCIFSLSLLALALFPRPARSQDVINPGEVLDLDRCISIALKHHPDLIGAEGSLKASQSRVQEAKSGYYPQVSANVAYGHNRNQVDYTSTIDEYSYSYDEYQSTVDLKQTIFDFGRTSTSVKVQSLNAQASQSDLYDATRQIIFGVRQAYYGILQYKQDCEAYAEAVKQFQLHLDQARSFYNKGVKGKIDVTNAEVNLGQAKLDLLAAENALYIARITLNNAMGVPDAPDYEILGSFEFKDYAIDIKTALKRGFETRPDLQSARLKQEAARRSVSLARKEYYPVLSGNAQYGYSGDDPSMDNKGWSLGSMLNIPLFSGFLTRYQVEEARANLQVAKANEDSIRQRVRFEIEKAFHNLRNVRERVTLAGLTMRQARENRELAQGRYAHGIGSNIEVADAVAAEANTKASFSKAQYDYWVAIADLERAMGEN